MRAAPGLEATSARRCAPRPTHLPVCERRQRRKVDVRLCAVRVRRGVCVDDDAHVDSRVGQVGFRGERLRTQHLERECAAETARADGAEARLRRLFVGINSAHVVSQERVRIRALEKNL